MGDWQAHWDSLVLALIHKLLVTNANERKLAVKGGAVGEEGPTQNPANAY